MTKYIDLGNKISQVKQFPPSPFHRSRLPFFPYSNKELDEIFRGPEYSIECIKELIFNFESLVEYCKELEFFKGTPEEYVHNTGIKLEQIGGVFKARGEIIRAEDGLIYVPGLFLREEIKSFMIKNPNSVKNIDGRTMNSTPFVEDYKDFRYADLMESRICSLYIIKEVEAEVILYKEIDPRELKFPERVEGRLAKKK